MPLITQYPARDTVRSASAQAVEVWARQPGKPVEISLNPEELGQVRMTLSTSDTGVTVMITSERPETLDLMRRHIDQLAQELLRLGYENTAFQFGADNSDERSPAREGARQSDMVPPGGEQAGNMPSLCLSLTGLDMRL